MDDELVVCKGCGDEFSPHELIINDYEYKKLIPKCIDCQDKIQEMIESNVCAHCDNQATEMIEDDGTFLCDNHFDEYLEPLLSSKD